MNKRQNPDDWPSLGQVPPRRSNAAQVRILQNERPQVHPHPPPPRTLPHFSPYQLQSLQLFDPNSAHKHWEYLARPAVFQDPAIMHASLDLGASPEQNAVPSNGLSLTSLSDNDAAEKVAEALANLTMNPKEEKSPTTETAIDPKTKKPEVISVQNDNRLGSSQNVSPHMTDVRRRALARDKSAGKAPAVTETVSDLLILSKLTHSWLWKSLQQLRLFKQLIYLIENATSFW